MAGGAPLLTIGYGGNRSAEDFVELLRRHGVERLVDVRSKPYSRFRPEFSKGPLEAMLGRAGFVYVYMGDALGGMPGDPSCYVDGKVDYARVRGRDWFVRGLEQLEGDRRAGHAIAIMCAELEPDRCHRALLVAEALVARGVLVEHIDGQGNRVTHEALMSRRDGGQGDLFSVGQTQGG